MLMTENTAKAVPLYSNNALVPYESYATKQNGVRPMYDQHALHPIYGVGKLNGAMDSDAYTLGPSWGVSEVNPQYNPQHVVASTTTSNREPGQNRAKPVGSHDSSLNFVKA